MDSVKVQGPAGMYDMPVHSASLGTRVLQGAGLAAGMTMFRMVAGGAGFSLGARVMLLLVVGLGGGAGGVVYYATDPWRVRGGVLKTTANVVSLLGYCLVTMLALYAAYVLGLFPHE